MTPDEKIEKLLNRYGQTISDLPKPADNDWSWAVYGTEHLKNAKKKALAFIMDEWRDTDEVPEIRHEVEGFLLDYICHLADVIDRMKAALETSLQEAKKPIYNLKKYGDYLPHCSSCGKVLPNRSQYGIANFCHNCGQEVKWI